MENDPQLNALVMTYGTALRQLVERAESAGVILTVERVSVPPLAMGRHHARIEAYASHALRAVLAAAPKASRIVLQ